MHQVIRQIGSAGRARTACQAKSQNVKKEPPLDINKTTATSKSPQASQNLSLISQGRRVSKSPLFDAIVNTDALSNENWFSTALNNPNKIAVRNALDATQCRCYSSTTGRLFEFDEHAQRKHHVNRRLAEFDHQERNEYVPKGLNWRKPVEKKQEQLVAAPLMFTEYMEPYEYSEQKAPKLKPELLVERPLSTERWLALACSGPRIRIRDKLIGRFNSRPHLYARKTVEDRVLDLEDEEEEDDDEFEET